MEQQELRGVVTMEPTEDQNQSSSLEEELPQVLILLLPTVEHWQLHLLQAWQLDVELPEHWPSSLLLEHVGVDDGLLLMQGLQHLQAKK